MFTIYFIEVRQVIFVDDPALSARFRVIEVTLHTSALSSIGEIGHVQTRVARRLLFLSPPQYEVAPVRHAQDAVQRIPVPEARDLVALGVIRISDHRIELLAGISGRRVVMHNRTVLVLNHLSTLLILLLLIIIATIIVITIIAIIVISTIVFNIIVIINVIKLLLILLMMTLKMMIYIFDWNILN